MKTSVALCTYNGAKYIENQLRSILEQTVPVGEVVVCDDGSSDDTLAIVERLAGQTDIPIRIFENKPNIGVCANFDKAIKLCKGDIIFMSDQDDVWMPEKVERIMSWFGENPQKNVVFTNATLIDSDGKPYATDSSLFKAVGFTPEVQKWFDKGLTLEVFLRNGRATGATMAIRSSFVENLHIDHTATTSNGKPLHDFLISLYAIEHRCLGYIDECLIQYRIHSNQQCGLGKWISEPPKTDIFDRIYWALPFGEYLQTAFYINRWKFIKKRANRHVLSPTYLMSCIKDIPGYVFHYGAFGIKLFMNDCKLRNRKK